MSAIWGSSFIFIRVVAPVLGPVLTVVSRVLIGGAVLVLYCYFTGVPAGLVRHWRQYAVIGVVNSTLPFMLFAFAALHIPASYSVILNSTAPLFTALLAVPFLGERLTVAKVAGLVVGAAGLALVSGAGPVVPDCWFWISVGACLCSAICYAASSINMKKYAADARPLTIAAWAVSSPRSRWRHSCRSPARAGWTPLIIGNALGGARLQPISVSCSLPPDRRHRSTRR